MPRPELQQLAHWIDSVIVALLEQRRHEKKEWHRRRKLGTLETLWLMLAVSLDTQRSSLYEILRLATADLAIGWSVSVPAFCKARAHFSPRRSDLAARGFGCEAASCLQERVRPLAWPAPARSR